MVSATALSPDRRVYISVDAISTVSNSGCLRRTIEFCTVSNLDAQTKKTLQIPQYEHQFITHCE